MFSYLTQKAVKYAKYYGEDESQVADLEKQLDAFKGKVKAVYQALAQDTMAPELPVVTNRNAKAISVI